MKAVEVDGEQKQEIIIVRRPRHDEEDGHHGGVWKIAFADFMTAMMCFFLVMWLINAANEETRAALASYFNPVKLIDRNSSRKGLDELGGPQSIESTPENQQGSENESLVTPGSSASQSNSMSAQQQAADGSSRSDEHLFSDPYAVLAEIAGQTGVLQNTSISGEGGAQDAGPASGASGGRSYRDPFAPDFWSQQVDVPDAAATTLPSGGAEATGPEQSHRSEIAEAIETVEPQQPEAEATPQAPEKPEEVAQTTEGGSKPAEETAEAPEKEAATAPEEMADAARTPAGEATPAEVAEVEAPPVEAKADGAQSQTEQIVEPEATAEELAAAAAESARAEETAKAAEAIRQELADAMGGNGELAEGVSVTVTDDGVMISITDELDSGMFEIGSAVPRRDLVIAMEKIGRILADRKGPVVINGHTDGRPFKSDTYDNWRLSTARAHSAYFMLVRGGLDERRIMEVAGFADRKLKVAEDPFADANRRIEILLGSDG